MQQKFEIFSPEFSTESLKSTGFKSTHYAIAELIDNSIQSAIDDKKNKFCDIELIAIDKNDKLSKILVIDNAGGMSPDILRTSLGVGRGRAREEIKKNRVGKGKTSKFGLGLKQASLSQCKRFEVYTWLNENSCYMSYLDSTEMETGNLRIVPEPISTQIPEQFSKIIKIKKAQSGTCVIWYDMLPKTTWKTSYGLLRNAEIELGRIYRHLIEGKNAKIRMSSYDEISEGNYKEKSTALVRKCDPLFLMKDCIVHDLYKGECFDEAEPDVFTLKNGSKITIKYSVAKKEFRDAAYGSKNKLNVHAGKNDGVSVVRNGRELELEKSFLTRDPRERFIGVEINFDATLDDLMGVDGKKQTAANFYRRDIEELAEDEGKTQIQYLNDIDKNLSGEEAVLIKISHSIKQRMNTYLNQIREYKKGHLKKTDPNSAEVAGTKKLTDREKTKTDEEYEKSTNKEKIESIIKQLEEAEDENSKENAEDIAKKKLRFVFTDVNLPAQFLFDIQPIQGIYHIKLNKNHPAYSDFFNILAKQEDLTEEGEPSAERGLKLLLESWARLEDEAPEDLKEELMNIRLEWGKLARLFFKKD